MNAHALITLLIFISFIYPFVCWFVRISTRTADVSDILFIYILNVVHIERVLIAKKSPEELKRKQILTFELNDSQAAGHCNSLNSHVINCRPQLNNCWNCV